jgi:hypothetical protein
MPIRFPQSHLHRASRLELISTVSQTDRAAAPEHTIAPASCQPPGWLSWPFFRPGSAVTPPVHVPLPFCTPGHFDLRREHGAACPDVFQSLACVQRSCREGAQSRPWALAAAPAVHTPCSGASSEIDVTIRYEKVVVDWGGVGDRYGPEQYLTPSGGSDRPT